MPDTYDSKSLLSRNEIVLQEHPLFDAGILDLDRPYDVPLHHHDYYEIFYLIDGDLDYRVDGITFAIQPGDFLVFPPDVLHQPVFKSETVYKRIVLNVDMEFIRRYSTEKTRLDEVFVKAKKKQSYLIRLDAATKNTAFGILNGLVNEDEQPKFGRDVIQNGMVCSLLIQLERFSEKQDFFIPRSSNMNQIIINVLIYINENYQKNCSLETLEKMFFVSRYYLSREFNKAVGISIGRYITQKRLAASKKLLMEGVGCQEVSALVGFETYPTFFRAFKKEYGTSPKNFYTQINEDHKSA